MLTEYVQSIILLKLHRKFPIRLEVTVISYLSIPFFPTEREVRGSRPTAAVLCPWARHFTPRKYWLITQEAMAPSLYDWKIVDWDVKPQHNQQPFFLGD